MATVIADEDFLDRQRRFHDFLDIPHPSGRHYRESIGQVLQRGEPRVLININDFRQANLNDLLQGLLFDPIHWLPPLEAAVRDMADGLWDPTVGKGSKGNELRVGLEGSFGDSQTTPRLLSSSRLGQMVCLHGIITSCSLVRPKVLKSVHWSEQRHCFLQKEYRDPTMLIANAMPTGTSYPTVGENGERLISEFGLSTYRDYQSAAMQEMPEEAPAGQLPRTVEVCLEGDLVDAIKPGDRVNIVGVYKSISQGSNGSVPPVFKAVVVANAVSKLGANQDAQLVQSLTSDDLANIRSISRRSDVFDLLASSLAPSIWGHEWVKKALLLQLLGGVELCFDQAQGGGHLRGDINVLMVGDPSTAKSQLLRFILHLAPLAIATTGRGASGVGLTAAVTHDRETGERRLEAGAMVLADRGIVCIDEFDKMSDLDRVAIHEVMEQQTVTIAKAGIHTSLNARCSVLAAANPIWGQYRESQSPQENIGLPDSLLSRFDLLFIILDRPDHDPEICSHVLKMHMQGDSNLPMEDEEKGEEKVFINSHEEGEILSLPFVKKYLAYAKHHLRPTLTRVASDMIVTHYATTLRQRRELLEGQKTTGHCLPVTPRTLETLIRLATAHAKARLSSRVEKKDAQVAMEMMEYCLYKEIIPKPKRVNKRRKQEADEGEEEQESGQDDAHEEHEEHEHELVEETKEMNLWADPSQKDEVASVKHALLQIKLQSMGSTDAMIPISKIHAGCEGMSIERVRAILKGLRDQENILMIDEAADAIYLI